MYYKFSLKYISDSDTKKNAKNQQVYFNLTA